VKFSAISIFFQKTSGDKFFD